LSVRVGAWWPVAAWGLAVLVVSSIPRLSSPVTTFAHADKLAHGLEYAVLGLLLVRGLAREPRTACWPALAAILAAVAAVAVFGALDEWHQAAIPGRSPGIGDWTADVVGAGLGALAGARLWKRSAKRRRRDAAS
jgi:VanZ family protein